MSYDTTKLSQVVSSIEGQGPAVWTYANIANDTLATILGAGYVSDASKKGIKVGDIILVASGAQNSAIYGSPSTVDVGEANDFAANPATVMLQLSSISGGAGTLVPVVAADLDTTETASTGSTLSAYGLSIISSTAAQAYQLPAPIPGVRKTLVKTSSSTAVQTVSSTLGGTAATFGLSGVLLTFSAADQSIILEGVTTTKWQIVSNVGTVTVS